MAMATQAPAGGGSVMAMPSSAMMMPTMPQATGRGPAGPAAQANASLGLFSAADAGLALDEVAIGIDLGGEWVRASVWDAEQKRVVALDLDGLGGPLRAVVAFPRPSAPQHAPKQSAVLWWCHSWLSRLLAARRTWAERPDRQGLSGGVGPSGGLWRGLEAWPTPLI